MAKVVGRVTGKPSGRAIPGLLVTAFALDGNGVSGAAGAARRQRLGCVETDAGGAFVIEHRFGDGDTTPRRSERWDLLVVVEPPGSGDTSSDGAAAVLASQTRADASALETVRVTVEEARLPAPEDNRPMPAADPAARIARKRAARQVQRRLDQEARRRFVAETRRQQKNRSRAAQPFERFLDAISGVPAERRRTGGRGYVRPGANIGEENLRSIREGIANRIRPAAARTAAVIGDTDLEALRGEFGDALSRIPAPALERTVWPWKPRRPGRLVRLYGLPWLCGRPGHDCVKLLEGESLDGPGEPIDGPPADDASQPPTNGTGEPPDVFALVHEQTDTATAPEIPVSPITRAALHDVQTGVDTFLLRSGPADSPALFDFHHLRIAFEPVWQELFDTSVVEVANQLYSELVELGIDPNAYLLDADGGWTPITPTSITKKSDDEASMGAVDSAVVRAFDITDAEWAALDEEQRTWLTSLAHRLNFEFPDGSHDVTWEHAARNPAHDWHLVFRSSRAQGERIIRYARTKLEAMDTPDQFDQFHQLLSDLTQALKQPYRFNVYAANQVARSVNFGIIVTYRQRWEPVSYQVGELVKSVPLAPKEVRRFSKRMVTRRSRAEKEVENSLETRRAESSNTWRAETEIVQKALSKTNFQLQAQAGVNLGIGNVSGSSAMSEDAAQESQEVKKEFREAVFKSAQEYKAERTLQVDTSDTVESTAEESGEITNPNDEIPVTYLFYQLQRRYRVSEECHAVVPCILVAQEFPRPNEIDDDWLVAHDWILRRALLDDSFVPALTYLSTKVVGDEVSLRELFKNLEQQRRILDASKEELITVQAQVARRYSALEHAIAQQADAIDEEESGGGFFPGHKEFLFGGGGASPEAARVRADEARDAYERAAKAEKELLARLERETTALAALTETYTKTLSEHLNRRAQISRLRLHVKQNIFYYMQAIWSYEPPDQRFFRLHDVRVPRLEGNKTYTIEADPDGIPLPPDWKKPLKLTMHSEIDPENIQFDQLGEVADLDNLLGFKGNYMIFPLRQGNDVTDFQMTPFFDQWSQISDPDPLGNWTLHDLAEYVCCLREHLSKEQLEKKLPGLIEAYRRLKERGAAEEEIIVPTDSLYIEALAGVHPVLEDFKLLHRAVDVKKVQAEVRGLEIENVRLAARLLAGEHEDPTIEKKVVIEGGAQVLIPSDA